MAIFDNALKELGFTKYIWRGDEPSTEQEYLERVRGVQNGEELLPTLAWSSVEAKVAELRAAYDAQAYARSRSAEYPPITDYLDGVVKGDQAQIDAYIAACQAVKAKYPKV